MNDTRDPLEKAVDHAAWKRAVDVAVEAERLRCAILALDLENRWRASAERTRADGRTWFFGWYTKPAFERAAKDIEAAADGLAAVRRFIREGTNISRGQ
jgi:hypothetical protein